MRILCAGGSLLRPIGGGEISARTLLGFLARTHEVRAIGLQAEQRAQRDLGGIDLREVPTESAAGRVPYQFQQCLIERACARLMRSEIQRFGPDVVFLHSPAYVAPAELRAVPVVAFVRHQNCFALAVDSTDWLRASYNLPAWVWRRQLHRGLLRGAALVVSNSEFMRDYVRASAGVDSVAVPPFIDTDAYRVDPGDDTGALTLVSFTPGKGAELVLKLADAMPERSFRVFARGRLPSGLQASASQLPNLDVREWTDDARAIYRGTRILLAPTQHDEPFGRSVVEAAISGIPSIASRRGGLPDAVADGGLLLARSEGLEGWIEAIRSLDDERRYADLSARAAAHARTLDVGHAVERLRSIVRARLGLEL